MQRYRLLEQLRRALEIAVLERDVAEVREGGGEPDVVPLGAQPGAGRHLHQVLDVQVQQIEQSLDGKSGGFDLRRVQAHGSVAGGRQRSGHRERYRDALLQPSVHAERPVFDGDARVAKR